ncbi:MAG TPA: efflux RND transporter periplasmic adaptor subunit [Bryobacteraceae bacterium]|nr:efflux RND transporter periplasmic adaptor subunit [Bryobacteraceae bacterium]
MNNSFRNFSPPIVIISTLLAAGLALATGCTKQQPIQAKQDTGPITVSATPVSVRHVQRIVESVGTLFPFDETTISAEIEGKVVEVKADLGDQVVKGQVLVRISDEEQRYLLAQNEAQLHMSLERLGLKNEADRIKDIRETSEVRRAQADLVDAEQRYRRTRTLVDQGIASQADLDQAQARYKVTQAAYDQAVNQIRNLIQEVERFKASLDLQRKKLRDATVFAPFTGRVKERSVNPGQYVRANSPLFTLVKVDPIRLRLEVPERMAPWIRVGQVAEVSMEAFADRTFRGKVWRIAPTVEQAKRTFIVEALIDNPTGALKPGSYAKAKLPTDKNEQIKLVPVKAINYVFGSNKAYVVTEKGTIEARDVKVGDRFEENVEIVEGVQEGEKVATNQLTRLDTGTRVIIAQRKAE